MKLPDNYKEKLLNGKHFEQKELLDLFRNYSKIEIMETYEGGRFKTGYIIQVNDRFFCTDVADDTTIIQPYEVRRSEKEVRYSVVNYTPVDTKDSSSKDNNQFASELPDDLKQKFINGEEFSRDELCDLVWEYAVAAFSDGQSRWYDNMTSIIQVDDRLFAIDWYRGLTEAQDNEYDDQPYEVERVEEMEYIEKVEYIPIEK